MHGCGGLQLSPCAGPAAPAMLWSSRPQHSSVASCRCGRVSAKHCVQLITSALREERVQAGSKAGVPIARPEDMKRAGLGV